MKFLKSYQNGKALGEKIGKHHFHYRLANEEAAFDISGKGHNAVVPFLFKKQIPIILSAKVQ